MFAESSQLPLSFADIFLVLLLESSLLLLHKSLVLYMFTPLIEEQQVLADFPANRASTGSR